MSMISDLKRGTAEASKHPMTGLLEHAVAVAQRLPADVQDDMARMLLQSIDESLGVVQLTADEDADLEIADAEIVCGELATDEELRRLWAKYGP